MIQLLFGEIAKIEIGGTEDATQKGTFHFSEVLFSVNAPHFFVTRQKFIGVYWLYSKTFVPLFPIHSLLYNPPACHRQSHLWKPDIFCIKTSQEPAKALKIINTKNCGIVKANAFLSQHDFFGVRWKEHYGE